MLNNYPLYTAHTQPYSQQFMHFSFVTEELDKRVIAKLK